MARYIDEDKLIKGLELSIESWNADSNSNAGKMVLVYQDILHKVKNMPAADVVPKSEVVNIFDELMKEAREIADRYEKSANETSDYDYARIEYRGCQMGALLVLFKIAELKKKYTESEK